MKITLIFPKIHYASAEIKDDKEFLRKIFGEAVSLTLPQVAAATPKNHEVTIIDENYEKIDFRNKPDLVGITCLTMSAPRAYEIADKFRSMGVPVVLGGNHPTALPKEAKQHADGVVIGEAEILWPRLLNDLERGQLKPFYRSKNIIPPEDIPEPRRELIKRKYSVDGLLIRRGCPNRCEFCTVASLYGNNQRSIENVIKEIKNISAKSIFIYDQNLTWDMDYTKKFLNEIKTINKSWYANGTVNVLAENDEFLKLAKEAHIFYWYIGFESISQKSLNGANKKINRVEKYESAIKKLKSYGMSIRGSFMFGFDEDTPDIFDDTLETINNWDIDIAEFHIVTPFPGTALYKRLKKEGRILTEDWSKYNTANVVFEPKNMSAEELFNGTKKVAKNFYSLSKIMKRSMNSFQTTNNIFILNLVLMKNLLFRERYKNQFNFKDSKMEKEYLKL
jgi:radical SAM superfamily enzyme YgiQ (UPF0313 family)